MVPCLPQKDPDPAGRAAAISAVRAGYLYTKDYLPPIPMVVNVPSSEAFSTRYLAERTVETSPLLANLLAVKARGIFENLDDLAKYEDLFESLPLPDIAASWRTDWAFAEQRIAGANPMVIARVRNAGAIPFTDVHLKPALGATTVAAEVAGNRLFVADYSGILAGMDGDKWDKLTKYVPKPVALFAWRKLGFTRNLSGGANERGELVPVAIQVEPGKPASIVTPDQGTAWLLAKIFVQIADANHHEMSSHLCRTHFVMAPFGATTARQLSADHPVFVLLRPHLRFMLYNNDLGRRFLVNQGGPVDQLLAGSIDESLQIVTRSYAGWSMATASLPDEIADRGVGADVLPHFPYREDGQRLWEAIDAYVGQYLRLYYATPADVGADFEIQAWARELASANDGNVAGMPAPINTVDQLQKVLTTVIFTCGPQHSAVNYTQYDSMAFPPNMPLAAYRPVAIPADLAGDDAVLPWLPPWGQAADQLRIMEILTAYHYDRLGHYDEDFEDPRVAPVLTSFQAGLARIEADIDASNRYRQLPYTALKPSRVLNSISI